ncbi:MAG: methionyl-tRNA formyltransferase [Candidatus Paceibacterota bacterium]
MKIVFFGTPDFAMPVLEALIGAGYNVSHFKSKTLKDDVVFEEFKNLKPDLCIVAAYGKILPPRYLKIPKHGFINVHPSILPKYRGPSPIQTAIINGDEVTGVSIMVIDKEIDHGPVLTSREFSILNFQFSNHDELAKELFVLGGKLLIEVLPKYVSGEIRPEPQNHSQATFTKMFARKDGRINWHSPAQEIYNRIRALNPEPGTWATWNTKIINIKKAELREGNLRILTIQMEGKKELAFEEFLRGHRDFDISKLN